MPDSFCAPLLLMQKIVMAVTATRTPGRARRKQEGATFDPDPLEPAESTVIFLVHFLESARKWTKGPVSREAGSSVLDDQLIQSESNFLARDCTLASHSPAILPVKLCACILETPAGCKGLIASDLQKPCVKNSLPWQKVMPLGGD